MNNIPDFFVFAVIIPKIFGSKIVLDIHDPGPLTFLTKYESKKDSLFYKLLLLEEKLSVKFADRVITVHKLIKDEVLKNDGLSLDKIDVVTNFSDEFNFCFIQNYRVNSEIKMVFHGTIAERFGLDYVLNEMRDLACNKVNLTIIGEGDYSSFIKNKIEEYKLAGRVIFANKFYPVHNLKGIYWQIIISD